MRWGVAKRIKRSARESVFLHTWCDYDAVERGFRRGRFGGIGEENRTHIRRACLRAVEGSALFSLFRATKDFLLRTSVGAIGAFFLLSSLFCVSGRLIRGTFAFLDGAFVVCMSLFAASVMLLHSRRSLSHAIGSSLIGRWLLFSVCRLPHDSFVFGAERGEDRPWTVLLLSLFCGALTTVTEPIYLLLFALLTLFFFLLQAVPELLFLMLFAGLPFLNLSGHPTAILLVFTLVGELFWVGKLFCAHRVTRFGVLDFFVLLFGALYLLGALGGGTDSLFRALSALVLLLSYYPIKGLFSTPVYQKRTILTLSVASLVCSLIGILQYLFGDAELRWVDVSRFADIGGRVTSLYQNPNVLAVYLLLTLPLILCALFESGHSRGARWLYGVTLASELFCLILTWSRGAWLGAISAIALFFLLHSPRGRRFLLACLIPVWIWLPLLPHNMTNRFQSIASLSESSVRYRLYTWRGTLEMLLHHPLGVGVGERAFSAAYERYAVSGTETVAHTHNLFLQIIAELGLPALLCFLFVLVLFARLFFSVRRGGRGEGALGGVCAIFGVLVMGIFDYVWYQSGLFWLFWAVLGASVGMLYRDAELMEGEEGYP